jgi:hypothetical protein
MPLLLVVAAACAQSARGAQQTPSATASVPPSPSPSPTVEQVVVPDIRHVALSLAKIQIDSAGLKLKVTAKTTTMSYLPNTILTQNPKPNRTVDPKSVVKVTVATPPKCDPSYPTICVPPFSNGITCQSLGVRFITVKQPDPYHLDPDGNGIGCESRNQGGGRGSRSGG